MTQDNDGYGGIERAQQVLQSGGRYPRLKLEPGARARFHFLTQGSDPWFAASKFHQVGAYPTGAEVLCLRALTQGIEPCEYDAQQPGERLLNRFACWVWLESILHTHDNPDEKQDSWPQVNVPTETGAKRTMFLENIGEARLLRLSAGKSQAVFSQFTNAWMISGDLRKHLYELHRQGEGLDSFYVLTAMKETPIDFIEAILKEEDIAQLPSIESIFRESLSYAPSGDGVLGSDELDGGDAQALPTTASSATEPSDDLI